MSPLFTSFACDFCDGLVEEPANYSGWVVLDAIPGRDGKRAFVFPSVQMAERYRAHSATMQDARVYEVYSTVPLVWTKGRGTIKDLQLAEGGHTVFPDHRHPRGPRMVHLRPASAQI
jgi:hypothetical protein